MKTVIKNAALARISVFVMWASLCLFPAGVGAQTIIETFDNGYPGTAGGGWLGAWLPSVTQSGYSLTASINNTRPLVAGKGNYLEGTMTVASGSTAGQTALLKRQFGKTEATGIDVTKAHSISFDFRGDSNLSGDVESFVFYNTANGNSTGTGGDTVWAIKVINGHWRVLNGDGKGGVLTPGWVTLCPYVSGQTYSFSIDVDPANKSWKVAASYDGKSVTSSTLLFRANVTSGGDFIYTGAIGDGLEKTYVFSIDNVKISAQQIPEPAQTAALAAFACIGFSIAIYRMRRVRYVESR